MNVHDILAELSVQDGGLIEVYVFDTDASEWWRVLERFAEKGFLAGFTRAGEPASLDEGPGVFDESGDNLLTLRIGEQTWTSMLLDESRIEFQGEPDEVRTVEDLKLVVEFLEMIHETTGKQVVLVPETMHPENTKPYLVIG